MNSSDNPDSNRRPQNQAFNLSVMINRFRLPGMAIGALLFLVAVTADWFGLSAAGFSRGQALIAVVGIGIFVVAFLGARFITVYKAVGVMLLNTLVLLLLIEISAGFVSKIISQGEGDEETIFVASLRDHSYYQQQAWAETFFQEADALDALKSVYRPFTVWTSRPFAGDTINISKDHHRVTPGAECVADAYTVFVFGGSTVFGIGVPDWGTIPAYLQARLAANAESPICVVNYGQPGYIAIQEVIDLILALKRGERPDFVIFYDGINEVLTAYQNGDTEGHYNLDLTTQQFNSDAGIPPLSDQIVDELAKNTYSVNLLERWFGDDTAPADSARTNYATMGVDVNQLAAAVIENYLTSYALVEMLAADFGFEFAFFWQPMIFRGKPLTDEERAMTADKDPAAIELFMATYDLMGETAPEYDHLYDIGDTFQAETGVLWADWLHLIPPGNEMIADEMLPVIPAP